MIKPKAKPCKGTGQAKGYGCGKPTIHRIYGLGKSCGCYGAWLFNSEAGKIKLKKAIEKAQKPRKDLERVRVERSSKKSLEALKNSLKTICHKYIRLRDKYKNCISCGAIWNEHFQAGHFYKAEIYSNLKFHAKNINGQCRECNLRKDGNFEGYRQGIIKRYGKSTLKHLDKQALKYKESNFKWDREKLKEERKIYNELFKELKNESIQY